MIAFKFVIKNSWSGTSWWSTMYDVMCAIWQLQCDSVTGSIEIISFFFYVGAKVDEHALTDIDATRREFTFIIHIRIFLCGISNVTCRLTKFNF